MIEELERGFGGRTAGIRRRRVSRLDPRSLLERRLAPRMVSGGRMGSEGKGYGMRYERELADFLRERELSYGGGRTERVPWPTVSPLDPRSPEVVALGGPDGHRMQPRAERGHGYHEHYARELARLAPEAEITLVELGILRGIGLAVWCDMFPRARVVGLDIDLSHFREHEPRLRELGAFATNQPVLVEYDELLPTGRAAKIKAALDGRRIDVMVDDALHDDASILKAMGDFMPHMADDFIYFIEDNRRVWRAVEARWPSLRVRSYGELTVVRP